MKGSMRSGNPPRKKRESRIIPAYAENAIGPELPLDFKCRMRKPAITGYCTLTKPMAIPGARMERGSHLRLAGCGSGWECSRPRVRVTKGTGAGAPRLV